MDNDKQLIIIWNINDLKISHVQNDVVATIITKLKKQYGKDSYGTKHPLTVCRGEIHDYLGMILDYSKDGKGPLL